VDVVFAHMVPRFAWLASPLARARRRPIVLWYVHRERSMELRLAAAVSAAIATAVPASFPLGSPKVRALGHGIDGEFFAPAPSEALTDERPDLASPERPLIVMAGRLSPIKRQDVLLRAFAQLRDSGREASLVFAGGGSGAQGGAFARNLRDLAASLGVADRVTYAGELTPDAVRSLYRRATVAVNLSPHGLFDKAPLESMMTATPTIVASASFDPLLAQDAAWLRLEPPGDAAQLARSLERAVALAPDARASMGHALRLRALEAHGLDGFMDRLVDTMATLGA
jgi:glycosyltransferase involved in cell wall biosynthesis